MGYQLESEKCKCYWLMILCITLMVNNMNGKQGFKQFVKVVGNHFEIDGKPYYFLGTNLWFGCNLGSAGEGGDRQRLVRELDHLKELGINNLRILGASEGSQFNTVRPSLQPDSGKYNEELLQGLDFLLAEMGKRKMYAVIFLNNYWVWSGGMAQYVAWNEGVSVPNPFREPYDWDAFMRFSARFYTYENAKRQFRQYVKTLINRTNIFTGQKYKDDPTIMSWQLANEPRPGGGDWGTANFDVFRQWIAETAAYIKSLDPNHLVSTGNEGLGGSMWSQELYLDIHQLENIDYMTFHLWILNWNWYNPLKPTETYSQAEERALNYIREHIAFANWLGKPLVLSEFGIPRDLHSYSPAAATTYRDRYYTQVFKAIYENAKQGGPLVGSNFWTWAGEGYPRDPEHPVWQPGDPYTGDPPQEPQGRNSVFNSDQSTLEIIRESAQKMNNLGGKIISK